MAVPHKRSGSQNTGDRRLRAAIHKLPLDSDNRRDAHWQRLSAEILIVLALGEKGIRRSKNGEFSFPPARRRAEDELIWTIRVLLRTAIDRAACIKIDIAASKYSSSANDVTVLRMAMRLAS